MILITMPALRSLQPRRLLQRVRRFHIDNIGLKLLALAIATLLFIVSLQPAIDVRFTGLPLEFNGLDPGLQIIGDTAQTVSVRLRGPRDRLRALSSNQISVIANLANKEPGDRIIQLHPEDVIIPENLQVLQIDPPSIRLIIEKKEKKTVKVEPRLNGTVKAGFEVYSAMAKPSTIEIEGPSSVVEGVDRVSTETIDLSGRAANFNTQVDVETGNNQLLVRGRAQIIVTVEIGELRTNRLFSGLSATWINPVPGYRIQTQRFSVDLSGPLSVLDSIRPEDLKIELEAPEFYSSYVDVVPHVILPPGLEGKVRVNSVIPREARLRRR